MLAEFPEVHGAGLQGAIFGRCGFPLGPAWGGRRHPGRLTPSVGSWYPRTRHAAGGIDAKLNGTTLHGGAADPRSLVCLHPQHHEPLKGRTRAVFSGSCNNNRMLAGRNRRPGRRVGPVSC